MTKVVFRCPGRGAYVQQWVEEEPGAAGDSFVVVNCPACAKIHLIDRQTHKLLGQRD